MTREQAFNYIKSLHMQGLKQAANVAWGEVLPFVPIDTGTLRMSAHIQVGKDSVDLVFGGKGSAAEQYAAYQYGKAEFHMTDGDSLGRVLEVIPNDLRKSVKGKGNKSRYAAAYRYAKDANRMTRFPGGVRWFRIILEDSRIRKLMAMTYRNFLKPSQARAA